MTVIAYKDGVLAADRCADQSGHRFLLTKVRKVRNHLLGGSGISISLAHMHAWFEAGADPTKLPATQLDKEDWCHYLIVRPDRTIVRYENSAIPIPVEEEFVAIGAGRDYAFGAMAAGATAVKAVEIASLYCEGCGGGVDFLRHDP